MAREGKFTRGPWAVNPVTAHVDSFVDGSNVPLCAMLWPTSVRSEAETEANARLIAAAPALYEALKEMLDAFGGADPKDEHGNAILDRAIAALQSAEPTP